MIQKIFFFFMIGISVCVAKPSEVVPASRGQDPLENRKQWQQEYRQILSQEKNQIKPPSQARNPRYMKRLYMDLKRMNDRIEAKQKKRLEEIARQKKLKIITLEDPIEIVSSNYLQLQVNEKMSLLPL